MDLGRKEVIEVFKRNFPYEVVETPFGEAVKMPAYEAFLFSEVTGSGYLENPIYPFTPQGQLKIFYNALDYNFVTGLFENHSLRTTPYILAKAKRWLFDTEYKYILPVEFGSGQELHTKLTDIFNHADTPTDYLVLNIETSKKGNGMEPFLEYLADEYHKRLGYIVENQIPLSHSQASPDFGGYGMPSFIKQLPPSFQTGFHVIELSMLRLFKDRPSSGFGGKIGSKLVVGEAKCFSSGAVTQLDKYMSTGFFNEGVEIYPKKGKSSKEVYGQISLDSEYNILFTPALQEASRVVAAEQNKYLLWLEDYMKFYLLANLSNDEFNDLATNIIGAPVSSGANMVAFIKKVSAQTLVEKAINGPI